MLGRNEILEVAKQTGVLAGYEGEPSYLIVFAKALMDVEREACAKEVENALYGQEGCGKAAKAIRARGEA